MSDKVPSAAYIVGTGVHRLIIDTSGGEVEWSSLIMETLKSEGISLSHVLLTHFHGDHTGGVPDLIRMYPALGDRIYKNQPDKNQQSIKDGQIFAVEGATIRCVHAPGHSSDHICFVLEEEQAMFTGDNILGHGTSAIEDLGTFMKSLQLMLDQGCKKGYPGHGMLIDDLDSKIRGEIAAKVRREQQVLQGLKRVRARGEKSATLTAIVSEIYGASLDEQTRILALEPFVCEVLRKLAADGKVAFERRAGIKKWYSVEAGYSVARGKMTMPLVHVTTVV